MYGSTKFFFFFFNDTATTEIYTLSLHDALPIFSRLGPFVRSPEPRRLCGPPGLSGRSEEHTSELQSRPHLVCRLLLEKKKRKYCDYMPDISTKATSTHITCSLSEPCFVTNSS